MKTLRLILAICALTMAAWGQTALPSAPTKNPHPSKTSQGGAPSVIVRDEAFQSAALGREMKYRILLPADYETSSRRFPVLYLLHGLTGSYVDWESRTHLDDYAEGLPLIIAMPDGDDSWYTNSVSNPQEKWDDYIVKDFIPEIDKTYRTIQARHARAIAGLSMGGYGAMKFALKFPGTFIFAASMSGALNIAIAAPRADTSEKFARQIEQIYGPAGSETRTANDPFALAGKVTNPTSLPFLWLACGTEDRLVVTNHEFIDLLVKQKIPHFYEESAGAHTWLFWDEHLPPMLSLLMERFFGSRDKVRGARPNQ